MPDPAAADPHTLSSIRKGCSGLRCRTGILSAFLIPHPRHQTEAGSDPEFAPYGIVINSKGMPFFCEFNTNRLASISPGR